MVQPASKRLVTEASFPGLVESAIEDAAEVQMAGLELSYSETFAGWTTTAASYPGQVIPALSCTVEGAGRPVDIEFFAPSIYHSVANAGATFYMLINGVALLPEGQLSGSFSPSTTGGNGVIMKRRLVVPVGQTWVFTVAVFGNAAGTTSLAASGFGPAYLSVVSR